jgi:AcrR family transcriptional regulator
MKSSSVVLYPNGESRFYTEAMATKKKAASLTGNRQAAYSARNRAALIKHAQEVLAEVGPSATIEQLSAHAQVSPTTIYKYFSNKEVLFAEAFSQLWEEWVSWSGQTKSPGEPLENVLDAGRKLFRIKQHDLILAQVLHNVVTDPQFAMNAVQGEGVKAFRALAKMGAVKNEDFDSRLMLWLHMYTGICISLYGNESISPEEADVAFGIGLSVWGISEAKAKKIISRPLVFPLHAIH